MKANHFLLKTKKLRKSKKPKNDILSCFNATSLASTSYSFETQDVFNNSTISDLNSTVKKQKKASFIKIEEKLKSPCTTRSLRFSTLPSKKKSKKKIKITSKGFKSKANPNFVEEQSKVVNTNDFILSSAIRSAFKHKDLEHFGGLNKEIVMMSDMQKINFLADGYVLPNIKNRFKTIVTF